MSERKFIAVDFDGTCTSHNFPYIGVEIGAAPVLRELVANGHKLILFTMRCNHEKPPTTDLPEIQAIEGQFLTAAVDWFRKHDIPLYGIQINPSQLSWTDSPKAYAHVYLDDAALGAPLTYDTSISDKPFYDWAQAREMLVRMGLIKSKPNEASANDAPGNRDTAGARIGRQNRSVRAY